MVKQIARVVSPLETYEHKQESIKQQIMATQRNSVKVKEQQKNILVQTLGIVVLAIVLMLLFIFLLLPGALRFSASLKSMSVFQQEDTIPPRTPSYSVPISATKESSLEISGYGESASKVIAVVNGTEYTTVDISEGGDFSLSIELSDGENKIALYSKDAAENESSLGKEYNVIKDSTIPEVEWNSPEDNKIVTNLRDKQIKVEGTLNETAKVYLNDTIVFVDDEGNFEDQFNLNDGENTLILKAVDRAGNEVEMTRKVTFKP